MSELGTTTRTRVSPTSGRRSRTLLVVLSVAAMAASALTVARADAGDPAGTIRTVAGTTVNYRQGGFAGDGGPATAAQLYNPRAIAFGKSGDVFIGDALNHRIRKIDGSGVISTIAGNPASDASSSPVGAFGGDGGPATSAKLNQPHGVAVDSQGNVYVADSLNNRIRKIGTNGVINTILGSDNRHGNPDGPADTAVLKFPKSLFMTDNDVLYICDTGDHMIIKMDLKASPLTVVRVAGNSQSKRFGGDGGRAVDAQLNTPQGVWATKDGTVYISDSDNQLIRKVSPDGIITTIAGNVQAATQAAESKQYPITSDSAGDGGPATAAHLNGPRGVAVDDAGNVYVAEEGGARIRRIDPSGIISTIAGTGNTSPVGNNRIAGDPGPSPATQAEFNTMHDLNVDSQGNLWIADSKNNRVRVIFDPAHAPSGNISPSPSPGPGPSPAPSPVPGGAKKSGYWMLGSDGKIYPFGDATNLGDPSTKIPPDAKAVQIEPTPAYQGYWVLDNKGNVYAFGDATVLGTVPAGQLKPSEKTTSISATPTGKGYWIFTNKGRVVPFGDAQFFGDMSAKDLNGPVLDSVSTPTGKGYYMVASDGGVFAFGDAQFFGSMGGKRLNAPVESLVPNGNNLGYWLVAEDGGIFAFGTAPFRGSMGDKVLNKPVVGMVRFGAGYLMVAADGGIFNFSDRPFSGSLGDNPPEKPVTSVATLEIS